MTATDTLLATLAPDPLIRGQQFERFVVTLLRTHPLLGVGAGGSLALGGVAGHVVAG